MDLETIIILSGIIQLIMLICFFGLCSNVSWIKRKLSNNGSYTADQVAVHLAMRNKEKAREALIRLILSDSRIREGVLNGYNKQVDSYIAGYKPLMEEVGLEFNTEDAIKFYKMIP